MNHNDKKRQIFIILSLAVITAVFTAGIAFSSGSSTPAQNHPIPSSNNVTGAMDLFSDKAYPEYAKGYSVEYHNTYKAVTINDPWGRTARDKTYLLVQKGEEIPAGYPYADVISIPVESVITLSATQLAPINEINETSSIKGHNGIDLIYNELYDRLSKEGKLLEIGSGALSMESQLKIETMIELEPDVIFCSASNTDEYDNRDKIEEAGLTPAIVADWMETNPLGRAEWIKYFALFYNKEAAANEIFDSIKENYTEIRDIAKNAENKPTVFAGIDYQGTWYAPGGESYVAELFSDAVSDYIYSERGESGSIALDFESVYEKANDAEFWLNNGMGDSMDEILAMDPRYSKFRAFKSGNVFNYDARVNEYGGNDYWQSGILNPDIILADLVKILHPDLLPDHDLYYYRNMDSKTTGGEI